MKCEVIDFGDPYKIRTECQKQCLVRLNGHILEEVDKFNYLCSIPYKHESMEEETRKRALQGKKGVSLEHRMRGRTVRMEEKQVF